MWVGFRGDVKPRTKGNWIPAFAGMTTCGMGERTDDEQTDDEQTDDERDR